MGGFPIHWEQEVPSLDWIIGECPFSDAEIEEYLKSCHYHWHLSAPPMSYKVGEIVAERTEDSRHFWLRTASSEAGEKWYVVIGTGKSPFNEAMKMRRWMYAEENTLEFAPDAFLEHAIGDQRKADAHFRDRRSA
ncbi:hypothetical protein [Mesorhizobium sp. IMUNJ 23232]|uniref:hypothetical protein n=1 Tax=Mesorhizobium sp. IMUNJ 23232 TaxID=3376064 RepID=UPI00379C83BD